jgi:hypothetical protein
MADLGGYDMRRQPTAAEVVGRLKDDGDFDALRRAIIRKVKDNVSTCPSPPILCLTICRILMLLHLRDGASMWRNGVPRGALFPDSLPFMCNRSECIAERVEIVLHCFDPLMYCGRICPKGVAFDWILDENWMDHAFSRFLVDTCSRIVLVLIILSLCAWTFAQVVQGSLEWNSVVERYSLIH